jgi:hypothetical protein
MEEEAPPPAERHAPEPHPLIDDILYRLNREVVDQLIGTRQIHHPAESGRARENVIAEALRRFVPDAFGVSTGFVIDAVGGRSRQQDIVIYRRGYHPVFRVGGIDNFLVESVVAVIQNRASCASRESLLDALDTIASVKALDRTNRGTNYVVHGSNRGEPVNADEFRYQVWGAVVTEASLASATLGEVVIAYLTSHARRLWPNVYADVNGAAGLFQKDDHASTDVPAEATRWILSDPPSDADRPVPPFVELLSHLGNYLRIVPLVDYSPLSYLPQYRGQVRAWAIQDEAI